MNNHAHVVRFNRTETQKWVEFYLNSIPLDAYVSGMAQPKLNQRSLNSIPIPFPPVLEQERIVYQLQALQSDAVRLTAIYQQKLGLLREVRQAVLQKAFSGELTARSAEAMQEAAA